MKNILSLCFIICITCCYSQNMRVPAKDKANTKHETWTYDKPDTDSFTSEIMYFARLISDGKIYYSDADTGRAVLFLENTQGVNVFTIGFEKNVKRNVHDSAVATLWFDEEKGDLYAFTFPSNDSTGIFREFASANLIIEKLKNTKRLKVKVTFSDEKIGAYSFDVAGLKWNYPGKEKWDKKIIR